MTRLATAASDSSGQRQRDGLASRAVSGDLAPIVLRIQPNQPPTRRGGGRFLAEENIAA